VGVSSSGYYAWRKRSPSAQEMANQELYKKIEVVYNENHGAYGSPRIYRALKKQDVVCSENRVARSHPGRLTLLGGCSGLVQPYIIGRAMSDRMSSDLTIDALKMTIRQRQPDLDLIHHSDRGSQYTDGTYQALLKSHGIQVSMNGVGSWYDNAPMESFFGTLKSEWVYQRVYCTRDEARADIFYYIEAFYNRNRLHSALGYLSPEEYELIRITEESFA
jgi:putative transposase